MTQFKELLTSMDHSAYDSIVFRDELVLDSNILIYGATFFYPTTIIV